MAITITKVGEQPGETSLRVEIPAELVMSAESKATKKYAKRVRIKGFRKGRAPHDVVRKRFGPAIRESALQDLVQDSWKLALEQEDLKPISDPRIRDLKFEEGSPVSFELLVEIKPDIKLDRISGFDVRRKVPPVTDDMVATQLEDLARRRAPWVPVEAGKPQPGDLIQGTLAILREGEEAEDKPVSFVLGDGSAIPEIEERFMALETGQTEEAVVKFPDDFADEAMRGQSRTVRLSLSEIKRQDVPPLDDEFAREMGDFETVADLKAAIRKDLEAEASREADADVRRQLIEHIVAANNVVAPHGLVARMTQAFAQGYDVPDEQMQGFATEFRPVAETQVKRDLVLDALENAHELTATEDELDERIAEIAKNRNEEPARVYASLQKANRLRDLERSITERKIFDYLFERNNIKDE